jgi:hypothetical protein
MLTRITKRAVDAVNPSDSDQFLWDSDLKGFGLKITPAGNKVYILQYRKGGRGTPTKRITIGRHGALTPEQARKEAARPSLTEAIRRPSARLKRLPLVWRNLPSAFWPNTSRPKRSRPPLLSTVT